MDSYPSSPGDALAQDQHHKADGVYTDKTKINKSE